MTGLTKIGQSIAFAKSVQGFVLHKQFRIQRGSKE